MTPSSNTECAVKIGNILLIQNRLTKNVQRTIQCYIIHDKESTYRAT